MYQRRLQEYWHHITLVWHTGQIRVKCKDCQCKYIGEMAKQLKTIVHEDQLAVRRQEQYSQIWTHMVNNDHSFDFVGAEAIAQGTSKGGRLLREAWLSDTQSINHHIELPLAYQTVKAHQQQRKTLPAVRKRITKRNPNYRTQAMEGGLDTQRSTKAEGQEQVRSDPAVTPNGQMQRGQGEWCSVYGQMEGGWLARMKVTGTGEQVNTTTILGQPSQGSEGK